VLTTFAALQQAMAADPRQARQQLPVLLEHWLRELDRAAPVPTGALYNSMQAYGMGLCALLHRMDASELYTFDSRKQLGMWFDRVCVCHTPWPELSWRGIHHIVLSLQLEFTKLFEMERGFRCVLPLDRVLLCLMQRIGGLICQDYRHGPPSAEYSMNHDIENVQLLVDIDTEGWRTPRPEALRQLLIAIHALLSAYCLLTHATHVPSDIDTKTEIEDFHRECSMDDFYETHMITTVPLGTVVQYKDKFRHLFHSVSQVVYFHYPAYQRTKQLPLEDLKRVPAPACNLLPLLQQLHPTVPVLFEHTTAGLRAGHDKQPFAWVVLGAFVVLVESSMQSYCSDDLRSLLPLLTTQATRSTP